MTNSHPSAQYSITLRIENAHRPGMIAQIAGVIAGEGGSIAAIDLVHIHRGMSLRDYSIECPSLEHARHIIKALKLLDGVVVKSSSDNTFLLHLGGKLEILSKVPLKNRADLTMAYTPGVARVCEAIHQDPRVSFNLTIRKNCIAILSDGSAVLGLGNIGPEAALPVMEGKAILFKEFAGVDAFPLCVNSQDTEELIRFGEMVGPTFGGINLEDIAAPRCFEIESRLNDALDIPVFHDDQHGTAVVVLAGLINALKLTGKKAADVKLAISGAGAAGYACVRILRSFGIGSLVVCDSQGSIHAGRDFSHSPAKAWIAENTNQEGEQGSLREVLKGADVFLGVSRPDLLRRSDLERMNPDPIIFALGNPNPEVMPEEAEGLASVIAIGRSDYPNQINNVLAFPGIFRGALDARAHEINESMKAAAAHTLAGMISEEELSADYIIPSVFNRSVSKQVARAVARAAHDSHVAHRMPKGIQL